MKERETGGIDMYIRKATLTDLDEVESMYNEIHDAEEQGLMRVGWQRKIYPTRETAQKSINEDDLFVLEDQGHIVGSAIINQKQVHCYCNARWRYPAEDDEVMVLHTLVISPSARGKGYGRAFEAYYEDYAKGRHCRTLRIDTNYNNKAARAFYKKLGYEEIDVVPTNFNGISGVNLVCLEKKL
jgi:GNAT superfamily N-acetyltransferase